MTNPKTTSPPAGRKPGRRRSAEADQAILDATLDILAEEGYGGFSVHKVIRRAGVSSATLYRRWPDGDALVAAALRSIPIQPVEIDSGSFDQDLAAFIEYLASSLQKFENVAVTEAAGKRAPETLRREAAQMFSQPHKAVLQQIVARACQRGELASEPPLQLIWTYVVSPIHHWLYLQSQPLTRAFVCDTCCVLSAGLRALAAQKRDQGAA